MNNIELAAKVCNSTGAISVEMSKDGIYLKVAGEQHSITEEQAEILWDLLPSIAQLRQLTTCQRPEETR